MDMIERVARAICKLRYGDPDFDYGMNKPRWVDCVPDAYAAIEEMREPTDAMIDAAEKDGGHSYYRWQAMIDAALQDNQTA